MDVHSVSPRLLLWDNSSFLGPGPNEQPIERSQLDLTAITYGNLLLTETLFAALLTLGLVMASRSESKSAAVLSGVALAAATYVRPVSLLLGWLWPLAIACAWKKPGRAILVFVTTWLLLSPWYVRQKVNHGELRFSQVTRINLLLYHAAYVVAEAEGRPLVDVQEEFQRLPEASWDKTAIGILLNHPVTYVTLFAKGVPITLLSPAWNAFRYMLPSAREWLYVLAAGLACLFWLWLPFSVFSISRPLGVLALTTAAYLIFIPGPQGRARFRSPAVPALAIAAGIGIARKLNDLSTSDSRFPEPGTQS